MGIAGWIKSLHVLSAIVLMGTGAGIAYFQWMAWRSRDLSTFRHVARMVVRADWIFTTPAVIIQPITGIWLMRASGIAVDSAWAGWVGSLYLLAGACWLPVVWIQIVLKTRAAAASSFDEMAANCRNLMAWWLALGVIAFGAVAAILLLMVNGQWH